MSPDRKPPDRKPPDRKPPKERKTLQELLAAGAARRQVTEGIKCPKCHCPDLTVRWTRRKAGAIRRRRVCANCGTKITTFETL